MNDFSNRLSKIAQPVVEKLKEFPEVKAIAFYGAIGYGYADKFSDIDLIVFCTKRPNLEKSKQFFKDLGIKIPSKSPFAAGFVWKNKEWTIWIELLDNMKSYIDAFSKKDLAFCRQNMEQKVGNYLFKSVVVWDPTDLMKKWKRKFNVYPRWLKKDNFEQLQLVANRIGKLIHSDKRGNQIVVLDSINLIITLFIQIIYALNDTFYPSTQWFFKDVENLKIKPKNCLERINKISGFEVPVSEKIVLVQEMFKELEMMCRKQIPNIHLTRDVNGNINLTLG
jgi:predicted nucleotidyltransferase